MLRYLRELSLPRLVLWCYLIWYLGVLIPYFDPNPKLWLSSFGISGIIGTGLYLSTAHAGPVKTVLKRWQIFRLFLMPLCVSSFAALIKGHGFFLVFHPTLEGNLRPAVACGALGSAVWLVKRWRPALSTATGST
jgi:hypothetical protein